MKHKLTLTQKKILALMANGWELAQSTDRDGRCWIQQGGAGRGGKAEQVNIKTVKALLGGYIRYNAWSFPTRTFSLTVLTDKNKEV